MPKFYPYQDILLVDNLNLFEKILTVIIKFVAYVLGYICSIAGFTTEGLKINRKAKRPQTYSYIENGETIYRRIEYPNELPSLFKNMKTLNEILIHLVKTKPDSNCIGERKLIKEHIIENSEKKIVKLELGQFEWLTFAEVYERVLIISSFLRSNGVDKKNPVAIFADTCQDWMIMALAVFFTSSCIATIYPTLSNDYILSCMQLTEPIIALVDLKSSIRFEEMAFKIPSLKKIVYTTRVTDEEIRNMPASPIKRVSMRTVFNDFHSNKYFQIKPSVCESDDLAIIMFTSGSTGKPKGVMIKHSNIVSIIAGVGSQEKYWTDQTYAGYLPLSHIFEFCCEFGILFHGGRVGYCHPNTLFDNGPMLADNCISDLRALKPTCIATVPLVLQRLKKAILDKLQRAPRNKRILFQTLYNVKKYFYSRGYNPIVFKPIFDKFCQIFGGNIMFSLVGGAYLPRETEEFFNICSKPFKQAYGSTETCCGTTMSNLDYVRSHNVGPPVGCSEIKIIPWLEGGYKMDDPNNIKGELLVCGNSVCSGYYKNDEKTKDSFIYDNKTGKTWFHTADIAKLLDDGTFRIIGRKSDIIKLSHGEYIELSRIETVISFSKYVDFVCLTTDKDVTQLIAVICSNQLNVMELSKFISITPQESTYENLIKNKEVIEIIKEDILTVVKKGKYRTFILAALNKYEIPSKYIFVQDQWTPESDLTTPSMKIKRTSIVNKYKELLENC
ncbi:hypothetical protein HZS_6242 [Henneguya salminicola]|nr:hypothetical protein HZS_6242 [Henneguya salminicola]